MDDELLMETLLEAFNFLLDLCLPVISFFVIVCVCGNWAEEFGRYHGGFLAEAREAHVGASYSLGRCDARVWTYVIIVDVKGHFGAAEVVVYQRKGASIFASADIKYSNLPPETSAHLGLKRRESSDSSITVEIEILTYADCETDQRPYRTGLVVAA